MPRVSRESRSSSIFTKTFKNGRKRWIKIQKVGISWLCTLQDVVESAEEFIASFSDVMMKLLQHHYVAKKQNKAFRDGKENLKENEGILVGDFAENHSFVVQDAAQGYHWDNTRCTLHPFVLYFKDSEGKLWWNLFALVIHFPLERRGTLGRIASFFFMFIRPPRKNMVLMF